MVKWSILVTRSGQVEHFLHIIRLQSVYGDDKRSEARPNLRGRDQTSWVFVTYYQTHTQPETQMTLRDIAPYVFHFSLFYWISKSSLKGIIIN